ncbi:hypothetical protein [Streptomyces aureocirculatus]|uniref:hypothetical protein n=1 Tax=Streptomyces aureocirculatus TaxID=67275 RepID=UPI0004C51EC5|nr:hypothetical protein [Streptomyces aureocirculatus]
MPITAPAPVARLRTKDAFALPEAPDDHLVIRSIQTHPTSGTRLIINAHGKGAPLTMHPEEPVLPIRMLRTFELTCALCPGRARRVLDLVLHGTPHAWVCQACS